MERQDGVKTLISVLTPTIRPEFLDITKETLINQTFKDFEWLVEVGFGLEYDLNKAMNKMIKRAKGKYIVFLQDCIRINEDGLQKFYDVLEKNNHAFVTSAVGKVDKWGQEPRWDWRHFKKGLQENQWNNWEIDWGCCPLEDIKTIGGFDEELDRYWSCDNVNLGCRAEIAGFNFWCLENEAIAIDHDKIKPNKLRDRYNPNFNNLRMDAFRKGLKIDYISDK